MLHPLILCACLSVCSYEQQDNSVDATYSLFYVRISKFGPRLALLKNWPILILKYVLELTKKKHGEARCSYLLPRAIHSEAGTQFVLNLRQKFWASMLLQIFSYKKREHPSRPFLIKSSTRRLMGGPSDIWRTSLLASYRVLIAAGLTGTGTCADVVAKNVSPRGK